jgi:tetratricopeptide (TPR) repeat protein
LPEIMSRLNPDNPASAAPPSAAFFAAAAIPARWALERGAWAEAAKLELRPSGLPYADALTEFARALGAARTSDAAGVRTAVASLEALRARQSEMNEPYWAEQIEIQRRAAAAWLEFAEGRNADAVKQMRAAADAEDRTEKAAVTPGPLTPAREQLGEMLLSSGDPRGALKEFEQTLTKEPNRFRALYGAARASGQTGDAAGAKRYFGRLVEMCAGAGEPARPELQEARAALARGPVPGSPIGRSGAAHDTSATRITNAHRATVIPRPVLVLTPAESPTPEMTSTVLGRAPTRTPSPICMNAREKTLVMLRRGAAPRATRMPISRVRRASVNEISA